MLNWIAENTVVTLALAGVALALCRLLRARPAVCHMIWVLVLLRLVAPPLPLPQLGPEKLIRHGVAQLTDTIEELIPPKIFPKAGMLETETVEQETLGAGNTRAKRRSAPAASWTPGPSVAKESKAESGPALPVPLRRNAPSVLNESEEESEALAFVLPAPTQPTVGPSFLKDRLGVLLIAAWVLGAIIVLVRHVRRTLAVQRLVAASAPAPGRLRELAASVAARMGMRLPEMRVMPGLQSPFVWGFGRTVLLWPSHAEPRFSHGVLAHELAHVRRRDHLVAWLDLAATTLFWWNPLVWFIRKRTRFYAELSCDAWAVSLYPDDRRAYAETLIDVAESFSGGLALGHAESKPQNFERRLRMILREKMFCRIQPLLGACAIAAAVCLYPTTTAAQRGNEPASDLHPEIAPVVEARRIAKRAATLYEAQDFAGAVADYRKLVEVEPENGKAWHRLGYCLLPIGRHVEAVQAFTKQLEHGFAPDNACYNLACAHALQGKKEVAFSWLEKSIRKGFTKTGHMEEDDDLASLREDHRFAALLDLATEIRDVRTEAKELFEDYDWKAAASAYEKVVARMPDNGEAYHRLGYALIISGRHADSIKAFKRQLETGYRAATALYNLACANALQGNTEVAMDWLRKSVDAGFDQHKLFRTDKDLAALRRHPEFETLRGRVLEHAKIAGSAEVAHEVADWETAIYLYEKMLARQTAAKPGQKPAKGAADQGEIWAKLADVHLELGEHDKAAAARRQQIKRGHEVANGLFELGRTHLTKGDAAAATDCISHAIQIGFRDEKKLAKLVAGAGERGRSGGLSALQHQLADAEVLDMFKACDWAHLQKRAEAQIAERPNGKSYLHLGWAHLRQHRYDEAILAFKKQGEHRYLTGIAHYNVACGFAKKGKNDAAFKWLEAAYDAGFRRPKHVANDPDLASLRDDSRFTAFVSKLKWKSAEKNAKKRNSSRNKSKKDKSKKDKSKKDKSKKDKGEN